MAHIDKTTPGIWYYCIDWGDPTLPSQVPNELCCKWLSFTRPDIPEKKRDDPDFTGKWMLYPKNVDMLWPRLMKATHDGLLGTEIKSATPYKGGNLMCVFTTDYRNDEDILRVLNGLRDIDIMLSTSYKTDKQTLSGVHGSIWYSKAGSRTMQRPSTYTGDL
jgi:Domain of unknown function (DUF1917)